MRAHEFIKEDNQTKSKAGIIPFYTDAENVTRFMFMIPSDPAYGGSSPNIAKGGVDPGEDFLQAAVREGEEELGLKRSNLKSRPTLAWSGQLSGQDSTYPFKVYTVEVKSTQDFNQPHYETKQVLWLTTEEFARSGRQSQRQIVQSITVK